MTQNRWASSKFDPSLSGEDLVACQSSRFISPVNCHASVRTSSPRPLSSRSMNWCLCQFRGGYNRGQHGARAPPAARPWEANWTQFCSGRHGACKVHRSFPPSSLAGGYRLQRSAWASSRRTLLRWLTRRRARMSCATRTWSGSRS